MPMEPEEDVESAGPADGSDALRGVRFLDARHEGGSLADMLRALRTGAEAGADAESVDDRTVQDIYDDLVGVYEVAEELNVSIYRVKRWIERRLTTNCPKPVRRLKNGHVYSLTAWKGWFGLWRITRGSETWTKKQTG